MHIQKLHIFIMVHAKVHSLDLVVHFGADGTESHCQLKSRKNFRKCASDGHFHCFFIIFATNLNLMFHVYNVYISAM